MHRTSFTQPRIQQPFVSMERGVVAQVSVWCAIDAQIAGFFVDDSQQINGQVGYPRTKACVVPVEKGSEVRYKSYGQQAKEVDGIDEVEYINIYYIIYKSNSNFHLDRQTTMVNLQTDICLYRRIARGGCGL